MLTAFRLTRTSEARFSWWMAFSARLMFWPLALLTLLALVLETGAWQKKIDIPGPFEAWGSGLHSFMLSVPNDVAPGWSAAPQGDDMYHPYRSSLRVGINGQEIGPAHTPHSTIMEGKTAGFSHWGRSVLFSLPEGMQNTSGTVVTIFFKMQFPAWLTATLVVASTLLGWLLFRGAIGSFFTKSESLTALALRAPYLALTGFCCVALIGLAIYILSSLYALATGWALPTTALIRWSTVARWAAGNEPYLGYPLLICAGFGAIATWLAGSNPHRQRLVRADETMLLRLLLWCGFPIAAGAYVFCVSAMWTGLLRPGDPSFVSIGGLISFSDASNYVAAAHDHARDGIWEVVASRRPLGAAFRSVLMFFSNYSTAAMLVLQACLLAAAACFAAYSVAMWRGIWAGIAFFGLTYIYDRTFVPTTLTEPLGLFWALLSVPFFIEAFRFGAVKSGLVAFAMTAVALMTRMGSMFTIPVLLLWLVWQFGQGAAAKLRIGLAAAGILLAVLALNTLLEKTYGLGPGSTGRNFAYTLCGLTMGTAWNGCPEKLAAEGKPMQGDEKAVAKQLYSIAADNFSKQPLIFFHRIASAAGAFVTGIPNLVWRGYATNVKQPAWALRSFLTAIFLIGLSCVAARRAKPAEIAFWILLWASIVLSASVVFFDDGGRVLAASHPLMALFFALGASSPTSTASTTICSRLRLRYASSGLALAAVLFFAIPWIAHRASPVSALVGDRLMMEQDQAFVFGGHRMSGFLVVEDGLPLRHDVPTLHLADFKTLVQQTYQGLPTLPQVSFGFVFSPRLETGSYSAYYFIVPADVIEHRDIPAWHFQVKKYPTPPGNPWLEVTNAEPWSYRDAHH
jgi:hypothetical protein